MTFSIGLMFTGEALVDGAVFGIHGMDIDPNGQSFFHH